MKIDALPQLPVLQPPGAGLPALERFVARLLLALGQRTGNKDSFTASFERERAAVRQLVAGCDAEAGYYSTLISSSPNTGA